jgi:hypothetical protein
MIGWFPVPYPGETFDSICYRYAERMGYSSKTAIGEDLFGRRITSVNADAPRNLTSLVDRLPPGCGLSADEIIEEHTFLPYYRPFLPDHTYQQLVEQVMGQGNGRNTLVALSKFRKAAPIFLQYCPECAVGDRKLYGETYWHRQHQLPGIRVCPIHAAWLESSQVLARATDFVQGPITAEAALRGKKMCPRSIDDTPTSDFWLRISRSSDWLLTRKSGESAEILMNRYRVVLRSKGYLVGAKQPKLSTHRLAIDFLNQYSPELMSALGLKKIAHNSVDQIKNRLTRWLRQRSYSSVLEHLLLILLLCDTVEEFFALPDKWQPFGIGPWPCLNRACVHYQQPVITECRVLNCPKGIQCEFQCECGYVYRQWLLKATGREFKSSTRSVIAHGKVWEERFRALWNDPEVTGKDICHALGVASLYTLTRYAIRLGFDFETRRAYILQQPGEQMSHVDRRRSGRNLSIDESRQLLSDMIQKRPGLTRDEIRSANYAAYDMLMKEDREYLNSMIPLRPNRPIPINWAERDSDLAQKVSIAAEAIRNQPGKPVRVTKMKIAQSLEAKNQILNLSPRLSETKAVLGKMVESREDFAIRRLIWAKEFFVDKKESPRWWELVIKAGVEKSLTPRVDALSHALLNEIETTVQNLSSIQYLKK